MPADIMSFGGRFAVKFGVRILGAKVSNTAGEEGWKAILFEHCPLFDEAAINEWSDFRIDLHIFKMHYGQTFCLF